MLMPVLGNHLPAVECGSQHTAPLTARVRGRCGVHTHGLTVNLCVTVRSQTLDFGHDTAGQRLLSCH